MTERAGDPRRETGAASLVVLSVVVLLGFGAANYYRSYRADAESHRSMPFSEYSTANLISLRGAYAEELEDSQKTYARAKSGPAKSPPRDGENHRLADRVARLDRTQAVAHALREALADVGQNEARLREVEAELERRENPLAAVRVHVERLFRTEHP